MHLRAGVCDTGMEEILRPEHECVSGIVVRDMGHGVEGVRQQCVLCPYNECPNKKKSERAAGARLTGAAILLPG